MSEFILLSGSEVSESDSFINDGPISEKSWSEPLNSPEKKKKLKFPGKKKV